MGKINFHSNANWFRLTEIEKLIFYSWNSAKARQFILSIKTQTEFEYEKGGPKLD